MFNIFGTRTRSLLTSALVVVIALVVAFSFGPVSRSMRDVKHATEVAKINGEVITEAEFSRAYEQRIRQSEEMMAKFQKENPQIADMLRKQMESQKEAMRNETLKELITTELLRQAARQAGLSVSDDEIRALLMKIPAFQSEGKFNLEQYERYVTRALDQSTQEFEAYLRQQMLAQKYAHILQNSAALSDAELLSDYLKESDQVDLHFATFDSSDVKDAEIALKPEEIKAFAGQHMSEITQYYQTNRFLYEEGRKARARHVLIKVPAQSDAAADTKARARIAQIRQEIVAGLDFAQAAQKYSEDSTREKGGDLDWFTEGVMVKPFEEAAFALKEGELSQPVKTQFGYHLIKLEQFKPAQKRAVETVKEEIAGTLLLQQRKRALIQKRAEALQAQLASGESLTKWATPPAKEGAEAKDKKAPATGIRVDTTGLFNRTQSAAPKIGAVAGLLEDAFKLNTDKRLTGKVYMQGERCFVIELKERKVASEAQFQKEKAPLREQKLTRRQNDLITAYVADREAHSKIKINKALFPSYELAATSALR